MSRTLLKEFVLEQNSKLLDQKYSQQLFIEIFSTQAETPDLGITKIAVTRAETPKMLSSVAISAQTTTEIVSACMGTSKSINVLIFGALGAVIAFFVVLSALFCVALIFKSSRKPVHMTSMR